MLKINSNGVGADAILNQCLATRRRKHEPIQSARSADGRLTGAVASGPRAFDLRTLARRVGQQSQ